MRKGVSCAGLFSDQPKSKAPSELLLGLLWLLYSQQSYNFRQVRTTFVIPCPPIGRETKQTQTATMNGKSTNGDHPEFKLEEIDEETLNSGAEG